ncbi:chain-length determining protein [Bradyrhizobium viridifuturi]|jgi:succinoglycan biosynthesis transport protein ExoP|nr:MULTISPECIES: exopolysaccharide transport family protein [Bradyrhizobium]ERF82711.1 MAG: KUP system potassium uptake protein [Bradyrhizobium sp. DFCI-1]OYU60425.1 MAG: chain-length determining protein [Bradyrhizobium sp. PARBB1]PSO24075.1 chain-length determining protein [Bradyrhizobium sp. MOS004]QRI69616.1 chain-length determining protein [Bradyrhizobium sp. PSBB068]MBR1022039.1 chain-length determining protein [Bradyrhizobium viridifuturi]
MSIQQTEGATAPYRDLSQSSDKVSEGVDLKDVIGILLRRKHWIFAICGAFCVVAATYLMIARPAYTAVAQVYVDPRDRPTPQEGSAAQNSVPGDGLLLVESQLKIITSNEVLTRVVDETGLANDPEFNGKGGLGSKIRSLFGMGSSDPPELTALRNLRLKTAVKRNDRSFVIDIMVSADTAARATRLTEAVANAYLEEQAKANSTFNRRISEAITSQLARMRDAVSQSERAVAAYKAANNLVGTRNRLVTDQELDEANTQLTNAKAKLSEAQARVKLIDAIVSGGAGLEALPEVVQSGTITQLRARAADIVRDEAQLAQINGPNHPALQAVRAQLRDVQTAIKDEVKRIAEAVRYVATSERTNVQELQARFDSLKALSQTNDKIIVPLRELERKADSDRAVYEMFLAKAKTAHEQQVVDTTNIRLISPASPPQRKSWPPTMIIMAAALFGGLTLGVAAALARDSLAARGRRLPKPNEVPPGPDEVPPRPIGKRIDPSTSSLHSILRPAAASRQEQLSRLSAELLAAPAGRSILLVRTSEEESLSLIALELARAVAETEQKAIVIDADLMQHPVTSRLRFDQRPGIRDILAGTSSISDVACPLGKTNIKIVPVGLAAMVPPDDRILNTLSEALNEARDFDRVIIDGGELGSTSSEYGLYAMADEVIFLASTGDSRIDDVLVHADLLRHHRIKARTIFIERNAEALVA